MVQTIIVSGPLRGGQINITVSGLEITNDGLPMGPRYGVLIAAENFGVAHGIRVSDMYIHDIRGTNSRKDNGGIVFLSRGNLFPSRFDDLLIERNILWRVDRSGIVGISDQVTQGNWNPSQKVVIRDNYLDDIGGDGIVPRATDGALVEHNIVYRAASRAPGYNVAIWQWSTDNTLIQLNEAAFTRGRYDGQGFDADFNSRSTTIMHNFSHDNEGGFVLICTPALESGKNIGNSGTTVRSNVSRNDRRRVFQLAGGITTVSIEDNVIHVGIDFDVQMVIATQWDGWAQNVLFRSNRFAVEGTARYGFEKGRAGPDYLIAPGFGPAGALRFRGNHYLGEHIDPPKDPERVQQPSHVAAAVDWDVPIFDPAAPDTFGHYIERHRAWMLQMLARELRKPPLLSIPIPAFSQDARWTPPSSA